MSEYVIVQQADGVLTIVLNRPDKKNAITDAMYGALADAIEGADDDPNTRVILLRAEGDSFTAGNDIADFAATNAGDGTGSEKSVPNVARFIAAISHAKKPIVAAAQGRAVGVGTTMLLHCDIVLLADDTLLSTPFVGLALVPEAGSSLLLTNRIGHVRAFAMFALADTVNAQDAVSWGIGNKVVPLAQLAATAEDVARRLAAQPLGAVMATKRLMRDAETLDRSVAAETAEFSARLRSPEAREAFQAFAERRKPDFSAFR